MTDNSATQRPSRAVVRVRCKRCGTPHRPLDLMADRCPSCIVVDAQTAAEMYRACMPRAAYLGDYKHYLTGAH